MPSPSLSAVEHLRPVSQPVDVIGLVKRFGDAVAVDGISFRAEAGKLTTLLGPSGCGKTTTLRAIGGFYEPDDGEIRIAGRLVNQLPPYARSTRTVFQSYALFPHMTVFENVAFGLRATKTPRRDIAPRVHEALAMVGLADLAKRNSGQLSGGQQQRVAFARALVTRPEVLLLDEPLSNLDAKLRVQMRVEIRRLQEELGITTIYVTHDQEEAMSLSDHVIVMNAGRIEQQGAAHSIYETPATRFVAEFIGTSNILPATVLSSSATHIDVTLEGLPLQLPWSDAQPQAVSGQQVEVLVRPEHVWLEPENSPDNTTSLRAQVESSSYLGASANYALRLESGNLMLAHVAAPSGAALHPSGARLQVSIDTARAHIIPASLQASP